jgi:hypothetical protein
MIFRRSFLKGLLGLPAVPYLPKTLPAELNPTAETADVHVLITAELLNGGEWFLGQVACFVNRRDSLTEFVPLKPLTAINDSEKTKIVLTVRGEIANDDFFPHIDINVFGPRVIDPGYSITLSWPNEPLLILG